MCFLYTIFRFLRSEYTRIGRARTTLGNRVTINIPSPRQIQSHSSFKSNGRKVSSRRNKIYSDRVAIVLCRYVYSMFSFRIEFNCEFSFHILKCSVISVPVKSEASKTIYTGAYICSSTRCVRVWIHSFLYCLSACLHLTMEAVAKHDFTATADDELSFRKNLTLKVSDIAHMCVHF